MFSMLIFILVFNQPSVHIALPDHLYEHFLELPLVGHKAIIPKPTLSHPGKYFLELNLPQAL